jgi:nitroreductase
MEKKTLLDSLYFRHACKLFDKNKKIAQEDMEFILESGRLAPSSFGMEHWKFLVIENDELKEKLKPACWDQVQITTCSHLVVVIAKYHNIQDPTYYTKMFQRRDLSDEMLQAYLQKYINFLSNLASPKAWCEKQCYLAAANMMSYAALIGVDSCPIEGFESDKVEKILEINTAKESIALLLPFGYRAQEQSQKLRLDKEAIITYIH